MGDEVGRTQHGSNNAFTLPIGKKNSDLSTEDAFYGGWALNWERGPKEEEMFQSVKTLLAIREKYLADVAKEFFNGEVDLSTSRKDLAWFTSDGLEMRSNDWQNTEIQTFSYYVEASSNQGLMVVINASNRETLITLPEEKWGKSYRCIYDSAESVIDYSPLIFMPNDRVMTHPHSVKVFIANLA
jgi:glycogen operon protein